MVDSMLGMSGGMLPREFQCLRHVIASGGYHLFFDSVKPGGGGTGGTCPPPPVPTPMILHWRTNIRIF